MTKRVAILSLSLLFAATLVFAHAGEEHTYLGTITTLHADGSFVMKMTNGKARTVLVSKATTYTQLDGNKGNRSELAVGQRVSAKISKDGKTALDVKFSVPKRTK